MGLGQATAEFGFFYGTCLVCRCTTIIIIIIIIIGAGIAQ